MDEWQISIVSYGNGYCEFKSSCGNVSVLGKTLEQLFDKIKERMN